MSVEDYERAKDLISKIRGSDFEGAKPESLIYEAENALQLKFPPSYRRFLLQMGCGQVNGFEVYGVIDDDFENSTVPDAIWLTLTERRTIGLRMSLVLIGDAGDGTYFALDNTRLDSKGEAPVVRLSVDGNVLEQVAESFGSYFLESVTARAVQHANDISH